MDIKKIIELGKEVESCKAALERAESRFKEAIGGGRSVVGLTKFPKVLRRTTRRRTSPGLGANPGSACRVILDTLRASPGQSFGIPFLTAKVGKSEALIRSTLSSLAKRGMIRRVRHGFYQDLAKTE